MPPTTDIAGRRAMLARLNFREAKMGLSACRLAINLLWDKDSALILIILLIIDHNVLGLDIIE